MTHATPKRLTEMRFFPSLILLLLLVFLAPPALAERPERAHTGAGELSAQLDGRMAELRSRLLRKRVGIDAERIAEVEAILTKGDLERRQLHQSMREAHKRLRHLIDADANDDTSYEAAVSTLLKSRHRLHELQHAELEQLRGILSSKEMGKLVMALHKLKKKMRRLHKRAHGDEMERGPRGDRRRGPRGEGRRGRRGEGPRGGAW